MRDLATLVVRATLILIGYVIACLAASAFLNVVSFGLLGLGDDETGQTAMIALAFSIPFIAAFVGYFAFLPAACVIVIGEILGRRDWLFYALGGAAAGLAVAGYFWQAAATGTIDGASLDGSDPRLVMMLVAAGMAGGIAYWAAAGRMALGVGRARVGE
jgi:hypothetical protein